MNTPGAPLQRPGPADISSELQMGTYTHRIRTSRAMRRGSVLPPRRRNLMATSCSVGTCCASWTKPLEPLRSANRIVTACLSSASAFISQQWSPRLLSRLTPAAVKQPVSGSMQGACAQPRAYRTHDQRMHRGKETLRAHLLRSRILR